MNDIESGHYAEYSENFDPNTVINLAIFAFKNMGEDIYKRIYFQVICDFTDPSNQARENQ